MGKNRVTILLDVEQAHRPQIPHQTDLVREVKAGPNVFNFDLRLRKNKTNSTELSSSFAKIRRPPHQHLLHPIVEAIHLLLHDGEGRVDKSSPTAMRLIITLECLPTASSDCRRCNRVRRVSGDTVSRPTALEVGQR